MTQWACARWGAHQSFTVSGAPWREQCRTDHVSRSAYRCCDLRPSRFLVGRQRRNTGNALGAADRPSVRPITTISAPDDHQSVVVPLTARIETLEAELAKLEATAAVHRAYFEREPGGIRAILPHGRADTGPRHCQKCQAASGRRRRARRSAAVIERWNEQLVASRDMLWSPTIRAALIAGTPWLDVFCPGCGTSRAINLRKVDRHPLASVAHPRAGAAVLMVPGNGGLHALPPAAKASASNL
jgi:hypothetical protein